MRRKAFWLSSAVLAGDSRRGGRLVKDVAFTPRARPRKCWTAPLGSEPLSRASTRRLASRSSGQTICSCSRRTPDASSASPTASSRRPCWISASTTAPSAACWASRCTRASPANPGVYLYWTCRSTRRAGGSLLPRRAALSRREHVRGGQQRSCCRCRCSAIASIGSSGTARRCTFDRNLIMLRAFQNDGAPDPAGPGRRGAAGARQPQRRRDPLRPRRQALRA